MLRSSNALRLAALVAASIVVGCDSTSPVGPPAQIVRVGKVADTSVAGAAVTGGVTVQVVDVRGSTVSGSIVAFTITAGDGSLSSHLAVSGSDGTAHTEWTIGRTAGVNSLLVSIDGIDSTATFNVAGTPGPAAAVAVTPRILRLPSGTTTAAIAGAVVDQYGNSITGSTTFVSRNTGLVTVNSTTGGVTVVPGASGTTYVVSSGSGFTDSSLVIVLKSADPACTGITATSNLAVGGVITTGFDGNGGICVQSTATGGEYAIVPYFDSTVPSALTSVSLTVFGTVKAPGALGSVRPIGSPLVGAAADFARASSLRVASPTPFHDRLRANESEEMRARAQDARSWYSVEHSGRRALRAASVPTVGDLLQLNVNATDYCANASMRTGRVAAVTARAVVVNDQANPTGFTDAEYQSFGVNFDTLVYALDVANFGAPTDIDNNGGRVILFFTHAVNEVGPGVLGYFYGRDLLPKVGPLGSCPGSNVAELMYLAVPDPAGYTKDFVVKNTVATVAHEFQHLINAGRRMYVNTDAAPTEERWLNEGLSHMAEELMFYRVSGLVPRTNIGSVIFTPPDTAAYNRFQANNFDRLRSYLATPDQQAPVGLDDNDDDLATRGAIWSFLRYAADQRFATTESTLWFNLVNSTQTGMQNLNAVIGTDTHLMMRDWTLSIFLDDLVTTTANYQQPSWNLRQAVIGYAPSTVSLPTNATAAQVSLRAGGTVFARFGLGAGQQAYVTAAGSGGLALPNHVLLALVRTK